jgi:uncharacterized membrane protein YgdD (TMEM256/DUF423 family)
MTSHSRTASSAPRAAGSGWSRPLLAAGALLGLLTVAAGAVSAHLPDRMLAPGGREMLRSAVQMQGWHIAALLACGLLAERRASLLLHLAGLAFLLGIACFCAGVYALAFAGGAPWAQVAGHAAPFGGSVLMLGWLLLAAAVLLRGRA